MKYIEEFRDMVYAKTLASEISKQVQQGRTYRFMEFCGGHTHAVHRFGIVSLLPAAIELIHGPGCPVCVLPVARIDKAVALAQRPEVILCTYADMLRTPGSHQKSLMQVKAQGADVRMVYSADDALDIALSHPERQVVFFAIGFETTTPPTAAVIKKAQMMQSTNFSVFCNHVLTPVAMEALLSAGDVDLDGFIGPAHVSIVIGSRAYESVSQKYQKPVVIAGFEPLDVMHSLMMLLAQLHEGRCAVETQYTRAVNRDGNQRAQELMADVFEIRDGFEWRGLGVIPFSGLKIRQDYAFYDAETRFDLPDTQGFDHKQCLCGEVLRGIKKPTDCKLFATACLPERPLGACMVSSEGACAAVYAYGRYHGRD